MNISLDTISKNYFKGKFVSDIIAFLPFGLLENMNNRLRILWFLKTLRVGDVLIYTQKKKYQADINAIIKWQQDKALNDPEKSQQTTQDYNYIDQKLKITAFLKIS